MAKLLMTVRSPAARKLNSAFANLFQEFEHDLIAHHARINEVSRCRGAHLLEELERERAPFAKWQKESLQKLTAETRNLSSEEDQHLRDFLLTSRANKIIQEGSILWRTIARPQGYVGDAESMNLLYRNQYEGSTPFGMLVHKTAVSYQASQAVRNRKKYLTHHISQCCAAGGSKILSVAAGPAVEILDYLQDNPESNATFLALDHDIDTIRNVDMRDDGRISYAIGNAFHMIKGSDTIAFPRELFLPSLDPAKDFKGMGAILAPFKYRIEKLPQNQFDLVYSAGLYDYMESFDTIKKGTKALTSFLFGRVRPGGKLVIGNFNRENLPDDEYFMLDYLTNWVLLYRNDDEMMSFLEGIDGSEVASVYVEKEPTGINSFLVVEKAI